MRNIAFLNCDKIDMWPETGRITEHTFYTEKIIIKIGTAVSKHRYKIHLKKIWYKKTVQLLLLEDG